MFTEYSKERGFLENVRAVAYPGGMWRHISLSAANRRVTVLPFPPEWPAPFGRGLASMLLAAHPEYGFVIANSLLAGTKIPLLTHVCMGARVPLPLFESRLDIPALVTPATAIKRSNTGGLLGFRMSSMGIGSISLETHDATVTNPVVAALLPDSCRFEEADSLEGLSPALAVALLHRRFGKNCTVLLAGPAARLGYPIAQLVISDHPDKEPRFSGRGGSAAALARCGVWALVVGEKKERAPWRSLPGANRRVAAFMHAAVALVQEPPELAPGNTRSITEQHEKASPQKPDNRLFVPCFTRRMDCRNRCPIGRLGWGALQEMPKALAHDEAALFPGSPEEAVSFAQECNRLGIDAYDAVQTLALSMNLVRSPGEFLRHLKNATPLGRRLGQGSRFFTADRTARPAMVNHGPPERREKNVPGYSRTEGEKERLAALDCLGLCVAASGMLTATEGREPLLRLLDMTAPGEPWSEERLLRLALETLEREAELVRKDHAGESGDCHKKV